MLPRRGRSSLAPRIRSPGPVRSLGRGAAAAPRSLPVGAPAGAHRPRAACLRRRRPVRRGSVLRREPPARPIRTPTAAPPQSGLAANAAPAALWPRTKGRPPPPNAALGSRAPPLSPAPPQYGPAHRHCWTHPRGCLTKPRRSSFTWTRPPPSARRGRCATLWSGRERSGRALRAAAPHRRSHSLCGRTSRSCLPPGALPGRNRHEAGSSHQRPLWAGRDPRAAAPGLRHWHETGAGLHVRPLGRGCAPSRVCTRVRRAHHTACVGAQERRDDSPWVACCLLARCSEGPGSCGRALAPRQLGGVLRCRLLSRATRCAGSLAHSPALACSLAPSSRACCSLPRLAVRLVVLARIVLLVQRPRLQEL